LFVEQPRIEHPEDRLRLTPHANRHDELADAIAEKYILKERPEVTESQEKVDSRLLRIIERTNLLDDGPLWRVKCTVSIYSQNFTPLSPILIQPGEEIHVLHQLLSKHGFLSKELRSAFFNPQVPGTLYLEASFLHKVNHHSRVDSLFYVLETLSSIRIRTLTVVPRNEAQACLSIHHDWHNVARARGEWVTIRRGQYKGDVGFVVDLLEKSGGSVVALVPRLAPVQSQKHQRSSSPQQRPRLQLFDPANCAQDMLRKSGDRYTYKSWIFEDGLILKQFHNFSLESARSMPSELLSLFCESSYPLPRASMPLPESWHFEPGDKVSVSLPDNTGSFQATISEIPPNWVAAQRRYIVETDEGLHSYSPFFFLKDIRPGDFVEILAGEHTGKAGYVVARNEALLNIAPGRFGTDPVSFFLLFNFPLPEFTTRIYWLMSTVSR
jgi:ribosomal protein L24